MLFVPNPSLYLNLCHAGASTLSSSELACLHQLPKHAVAVSAFMHEPSESHPKLLFLIAPLPWQWPEERDQGALINTCTAGTQRSVIEFRISL